MGEKIMKPILPAALLALAALAAQPVRAENLLDVYRLAQQNDMVMAQAQANFQAGLERRAQGTGQLLPSLSFSASHFAVDQEIRQPPPTHSNDFDSDTYSVLLTQPIYRKSNIAAYNQGKAYAALAEADLAITAGELMLRAAQAYFDVLAAEDTLGFARTEKAAIEGQRRLAERNFAVGNATVVDVHEARARHDQAAAQEVNAELDLEVKREALVLLTRERPARLARLLWEGGYLQPDPPDLESWHRIAQERNPVIHSYEHAVRVAEQEVEKNRGGHHPTLDLVASHGYNKNGSVFSPLTYEYTTNQVGVQLQVPLFSGGITQSKVREAVARHEQSRAALEQARRTITRMTREAYLASTGGITRAQALYQARVSSRQALESTLIGYESGVRTGVDVLNAQRDLYRTERELSQARYQYVLSMLRLKLAAGTLSEADLVFINDRLVYAEPPR
jgi:outer membrane protein